MRVQRVEHADAGDLGILDAGRIAVQFEAAHDPRVAAAPHDQPDRPLRLAQRARRDLQGKVEIRQRDEDIRADAEVVEGRRPAPWVGAAERARRSRLGHLPELLLAGAGRVFAAVVMLSAIWRLAPTHHSNVYWAT